MAFNVNAYWHSRYYKALTALGKKLTGDEDIQTYKSMWKDLDKEYKQRGEKRPTLKEANSLFTEHDYEQTPRDENMHTSPANVDLDEDLANQILDNFEADIEDIYRNTLDFISYYTRKGVSHDEGKLASIAEARKSEIDDSYIRLKEKLQTMRNDIPPATLAQAIQDNVELDYEISVTLMPPSDIQLEFERTLAHLEALTLQIEERARELAEREYYGM